MVVEPSRHRFSIERYEHMLEAGVLTPDDRVELIDGEIVEMPPIGPEHATTTEHLAELLRGILGDRAAVRVQHPIRLPPDSEPEPDVAVVLPPLHRYLHQHPGPTDVLLAIEVAKAMVAWDRQRKIRTYARHGIVESWLVNLPDRRLEVFTDPGPDGYLVTRTLGPRDVVAPQRFPDAQITADDIFP